jgi:riboflavin kinase/FMN adenylyltransferase
MEFHHYVRGDIKFSSLDELKVQLAKDKEDVLALL